MILRWHARRCCSRAESVRVRPVRTVSGRVRFAALGFGHAHAAVRWAMPHDNAPQTNPPGSNAPQASAPQASARLPTPAPIREIRGADPRALPAAVLDGFEPVVLRGLVADWPLVQAGLSGADAASAYLLRFYRGAPVRALVGPPDIRGRFFYNEDLSGFNFRQGQDTLDRVLAALANHRKDAEPPALYVGATAVDGWLPGFRAENDVALGDRNGVALVWIGNRTRVAPHQDVPDNLACVAVGRRRFTVFPPEQLANLYIGPLDMTPAGQAISLVDLHAPDLERFPRFAEAWRFAQVAELDSGDAIFIPSQWWHHIEALDEFNVLVNYWWRRAPAHLDSPLDALMLAFLSLRDLPEPQRRAWQETFRHYIFEPGEATADHIPEAARSLLATMDARAASGLRAQLLARLGKR